MYGYKRYSLPSVLLISLLSALITGCAPGSVTTPSPQLPAATQQLATPVPNTATTVPPTASPVPSPTALPLTSTLTATVVPPTVTLTLPKPSATRTPSATPMPTFAFYNKTVKAPAGGARLLSFDQGVLWIAAPDDSLSRIDTKTGKTISSQKFGCKVCFGPCDLFTVAREGQYFWALQYGGIGEQDCTADDPWKSIGFMLRKVKAGSNTSEYIDVSSLVSAAETPDTSAIAINDNKIWLALGETIYVIDAAKSKPDQPAVIKTIFPGIYVEGLLFADNKMWAGGDALLSIHPTTYQVSGIYPLEAQILAFDGKKMWGVSKYQLTLQSIDLATRELSEPMPFYDIPTAVGFDGKNLWVAFDFIRDLATIPAVK